MVRFYEGHGRPVLGSGPRVARNQALGGLWWEYAAQGVRVPALALVAAVVGKAQQQREVAPPQVLLVPALGPKLQRRSELPRGAVQHKAPEAALQREVAPPHRREVHPGYEVQQATEYMSGRAVLGLRVVSQETFSATPLQLFLTIVLR